MWLRCRRALSLAFTGLVLVLMVHLARRLDWAGALDAVQDLPTSTLLAAAALALTSHLLYSTFDLVGRQQTGHGLPVPSVMAVAFTSYAFNLNLGTLVGGLAMRYRLYGRLGVAAGSVTRVLALSMLTNWSGYLVLAGTLVLWQPPPLPPAWAPPGAVRVAVGLVLLGLPLAYLVACSGARRRLWVFWGHPLQAPSGRVALLQLVQSVANWLLMAAICWVLLQQRLPFATVLGVLLLAAVAGVVTHVPAGLGVLEAVFLTLLAPPLAQGPLLAALLAYRALYYLAPLAVAAAMLFVIGRRVGPPAPAG